MSDPMEDLVEVVARAIASDFWCDSKAWGDLPADDAQKEDWRVSARTAISAINASGIAKVAPVEATEEMCEAAYEEASRMAKICGMGDDLAPRSVWSAMLSAAPKVEG